VKKRRKSTQEQRAKTFFALQRSVVETPGDAKTLYDRTVKIYDFVTQNEASMLGMHPFSREYVGYMVTQPGSLCGYFFRAMEKAMFELVTENYFGDEEESAVDRMTDASMAVAEYQHAAMDRIWDVMQASKAVAR
jgi:hypothetical protein